ncbi:MAG: prepilin-type N-terminal cleavage/methylation domain-containing protein [Planctomycetaceae bacterium]|jgi:prepilin-type N-terminal cleavage/methylation domain-containing protein|nr:prepilin-type N-terminal cleavage/methylation domain-containing protein [Planctomycetaceae bacterium]
MVNQFRFSLRTGFTLLELLIVLGLIVAIFSLGFSGIRRLYVRNQLKSTTQHLQNILYKTRLESVKTGKAFVFRYQYDSPVFEILPKDLFDQREQNREDSPAIAIGAELLLLQKSSSASPESMSPEQNLDSLETTTLTSDKNSDIYRQMLPNSIVFGSKQPDTALTANESGLLPQQIPSENWSAPILFFPNGRTSQTTLILRTTSRYRFQQELTLRGLTGTTKINSEPSRQ